MVLFFRSVHQMSPPVCADAVSTVTDRPELHPSNMSCIESDIHAKEDVAVANAAFAAGPCFEHGQFEPDPI